MASRKNCKRVVRSFSDPALIALADARAKYVIWRDWPAEGNGVSAAWHKAHQADYRAWMRILQITPSTITGALAVARFMLEREALEDCATYLPGSDTELNIGALAAEKLLAVFGNVATDPAIAAADAVDAASRAWAALPDNLPASSPRYSAAAAAFHQAREALQAVQPTSTEGAGRVAEVVFSGALSGLMQEKDMRLALHNIALAFGSQATEELANPINPHAIAAE